MGNFYVNIAVRSDDRDALLNAIPLTQDPGVIGPAENGWTVLSSAALDTQDDTVVTEYGTALSNALKTDVLGALNHDDDFLMLWLFRDGHEVSFFNSDPGTLRGVDGFAGLMNGDAPETQALLLKPSVFAVDHHHEIATAFGLPDYTAGFGFRYAERGEFPHLDLLKYGH